MHSNVRTRWLAAAISAVVAAAAGVAVFLALPSPALANADSAINGFRNVAYFTQWGVYGRGYTVKDIETSGLGSKLTHINYAFANIHYQTLTCFEANKAQGTGPTGSDGAGDAYADYGKSYSTAESVSGAADAWDQPLAGSFNQLKQLKAKHPQLRVLLSIGGWTWSKNFSKAAATAATRQAFVSSCIDMFIKGNLPVIDGRGGTGSAAGVFDGFDIDWEWPGSTNGLEGNYVDPVNDRANFSALLAEFRTQLNAYGTQTGRDYLLSAFLPANPADIAAGGWNDPAIFNSLDYGNVQGYDLHGAWEPTLTGHQGNLYDDPADPRAADKRFSVNKAVTAYTSAGVPARKLGLGLAMYGRGWTGVTTSTPWSTATGAAPGTWEAGIEDYDLLKSRGTGFYSSSVGASWRYDGTQWWTLDDPQSVTLKANYIRSKGLGGAMWWELSGDEAGDLPNALSGVLGAGTPGPVVSGTIPSTTTSASASPSTSTSTSTSTGCSAAAWNSTAVYTSGQQVTYNGHLWQAKWWTQNNVPGADQWGPWQDLGACGTTTATTTRTTTTSTSPSPSTSTSTSPSPSASTSTGTYAAWVAGHAYAVGDRVTYNGVVYQCRQAHTSLVGWEPPNVPALWLAI